MVDFTKISMYFMDMGLLSFIFGKKPKLEFTQNGRVYHNHPEKKWEDWKNRFRQNPDYNWRSHSGTKGVPQLKSKKQK